MNELDRTKYHNFVFGYTSIRSVLGHPFVVTFSVCYDSVLQYRGSIIRQRLKHTMRRSARLVLRLLVKMEATVNV